MFSLDYGTSAPDDQLDYVNLCLSRNLSAFNCNPTYRQTNPFGQFPLNLPDDGLYQFYTIAHLKNGQVEPTKDDYFSVQVDTQSPTVNLNLGEFAIDHFMKHERLTNGNFEDLVDPWRSWTSTGDNQIVIDPITNSNVAQVGWSGSSISQILSIGPTLSTLSFRYRYMSEDSADFDWFEAGLTDTGTSQTQLISQIGAPMVGGYDTGWQSVVYSLGILAPSTQNLFFKIINHDVGDTVYKSNVFIDDVRLNYDLPSVDILATPSLSASDLGSGISQTFYKLSGSDWLTTDTPILLSSTGPATIDFYTSDIAGNTSPPQSQTLTVVDPLTLGITINKVSPSPSGSDSENEFVELWNNGDSDVNVVGWKLKRNDFLTISLLNSGTGVVPAHGSLKVYRHGSTFSLVDSGGVVELWSGGVLIDSYKYPNTTVDDQTWKRNPDGTGIFIDPPEPIFDVSFQNNTLNIKYSLPVGFTKFEYEVLYQNQGQQKGIYSQIKPEEIINNFFSRSLFIGTCSQNVCRPDYDQSSPIIINLSVWTGDILKTKKG